MKPAIVIIAGPTAVGKTEYAIAAARALSGQIISADSMQLYRWMDIGSAKPTEEERRQAVHLMVDEIDPRKPFSAAAYCQLATGYIQQTLDKGMLPIISGGTGLYVNSLIYEMDFSTSSSDHALRKELEESAKRHGNSFVHQTLVQLDPEAARRIHPNNLKKVIRAIEILQLGKQQVRPFSQVMEKRSEYDAILIGLCREREELYQRIDLRVDQLVSQGLFSEVRRLLSMGLTAENISMKGIGYKEIIGYLNEEYDQEEAIRLVKRNTRHYAKRQMTWFRRYPDMCWINLSQFSSPQSAKAHMLEEIQSRLEGRAEGR